MLSWPYAQRWQQTSDGYLISIEHSTESRRIYDKSNTDNAADTVPTVSGYSVGERIDEHQYEVRTDQFITTAWGAHRGVDSGPNKVLIERYTLHDDGLGMSLEYTLSDPMVLTESVQGVAQFERLHEYC